jgi:hypothetical protein
MRLILLLYLSLFHLIPGYFGPATLSANIPEPMLRVSNHRMMEALFKEVFRFPSKRAFDRARHESLCKREMKCDGDSFLAKVLTSDRCEHDIS